jgi:hypothetical protein
MATCLGSNKTSGLHRTNAGFEPRHLNYRNPGLAILSQDDPHFYRGHDNDDIEEVFFPVMHADPLEIMQRETPELYTFYTNVKEAQETNTRFELGIRGAWEFTDVEVSGPMNTTPFIIVHGVRAFLEGGAWSASVKTLYIFNTVGNAMSIYDENDQNRYFFGAGETINFLNQYFDDFSHMTHLDNKLLFQFYSDVNGFHSAVDLEFYNSKYWHVWSQNGDALLGHGTTGSGKVYRFVIRERKELRELTLLLVDDENRTTAFHGNEHFIVDKLNVFFAIGYLNPLYL